MNFPTTISSLLSFYKHERRIFGRCPCCKEVFRLSDVKLTFGKEPPRDLFNQLTKQRDELRAKLEEIEAELEQREEEHAIDLAAVDGKWNERFELEVDRRTTKRVKEIREKAILRSRAGQLGKTLEKVVPMFPGFGHHPYDVRPIFDPIDFVVFDGYFKGEVTDICFVEFKTGHARMNDVQSSIKNAIQKKRVHFEEKRLGKSSLDALIKGQPLQAKRLVKQLLT